MAVARTQAVSANAASVALSSTNAGDLIVVFAYNGASTTIPSLPAGFTSFDSAAGTSQAFRAGYKLSAGGDTTSGTWTNASQVVAHVYSGAMAIGTGHNNSTGNTAILGYVSNSGFTLQDATGNSWIAGFGGARSATAGMNGNTTHQTNRTNLTTVNGLDTGAGVAAGFQDNLSVTGTGRWITEAVEIRSITIAFAGAAGTFTFTGGDAVPLISEAATTGTIAITGGPAVPLISEAATTGTIAITGGPAVPLISGSATTGTFTVTGGAAIWLQLSTAATGAFALTGGDAYSLITSPSASTQGAAVLPRHIILEKLEEAAIIAAILAEVE